MCSSAKPLDAISQVLQAAVSRLCTEHFQFERSLSIIGVVCVNIDGAGSDVMIKFNDNVNKADLEPGAGKIVLSSQLLSALRGLDKTGQQQQQQLHNSRRSPIVRCGQVNQDQPRAQQLKLANPVPPASASGGSSKRKRKRPNPHRCKPSADLGESVDTSHTPEQRPMSSGIEEPDDDEPDGGRPEGFQTQPEADEPSMSEVDVERLEDEEEDREFEAEDVEDDEVDDEEKCFGNDYEAMRPGTELKLHFQLPTSVPHSQSLAMPPQQQPQLTRLVMPGQLGLATILQSQFISTPLTILAAPSLTCRPQQQQQQQVQMQLEQPQTAIVCTAAPPTLSTATACVDSKELQAELPVQRSKPAKPAPQEAVPATTGAPNGGSAKVFKCSYCGKAFNRKFCLERHERLHTGVKPYECQLCGERYIRLEDKKRHMRSAHPNDFMNYVDEQPGEKVAAAADDDDDLSAAKTLALAV